MEQLIPMLVGVAILVAWRVLETRSSGRIWSPLWLAFSTTSLAALFLVAGTIGYTLSKRTRFIDGTAWSETVIWWQIGVGVVLIPLAGHLWRKGLHSIAEKRPSHV